MDDKEEERGESSEAAKDKDEVEEGEIQEDADVVESESFYDKTKSFFDKISCNAGDNAKGSVRKPNWKVEKKINKETFGITGNFNPGRGHRGGFQRGRGGSGGYNRIVGGYNKAPNSYYRGGFYGGQY